MKPINLNAMNSARISARPFGIAALADNMGVMLDHLDNLDERRPAYTDGHNPVRRYIEGKIESVRDEKAITEKLICNAQACEGSEGLIQLILASSKIDLILDDILALITEDGDHIKEMHQEVSDVQKALRSALRQFEQLVEEKGRSFERIKQFYAADYTYPFDDRGEDDYRALLDSHEKKEAA